MNNNSNNKLGTTYNMKYGKLNQNTLSTRFFFSRRLFINYKIRDLYSLLQMLRPRSFLFEVFSFFLSLFFFPLYRCKQKFQGQSEQRKSFCRYRYPMCLEATSDGWVIDAKRGWNEAFIEAFLCSLFVFFLLEYLQIYKLPLNRRLMSSSLEFLLSFFFFLANYIITKICILYFYF